MILRKITLLAQAVGFLTIGLLAIYGGFMFVSLDPLGIGDLFAVRTVYAQSSDGTSLEVSSTTNVVPPYLSYEGILRDPEGRLISGTHSLTISIYDQAAGGNQIWTSGPISDVVVRDGRFSVLLGGPTNPITETQVASQDRYIGIKLDDYDEMMPRQRFASVPYALRADRAASLARLSAAPTDTSLYVDNNGILHVQGGDQRKGRLWLDNNTNDYGKIERWENYFELTSNDMIRFTIAGNPSEYSVIDRDGNVGIGTQDPSQKLTVQGGFLNVKDSDGAHEVMLGTGASGSVLSSVAAEDKLMLRTQALTRMTIEADGDVGVGTMVPEGKLDVNGSLVVRGLMKMPAKRLVEVEQQVDFREPILFKYFNLAGGDGEQTGDANNFKDFPTDILVSDYVCGIAGWAVTDVDIREGDAGNYGVEPRVNGDYWSIRVSFFSQDDHEDTIKAYLLCVDEAMARREGY